MAAGGAFAGIAIGRNIALLQERSALAPEAWAPLHARGLAPGKDDVGPTLEGLVADVACRVSIITDAVKFAYTKVVVKPAAGEAVTVGVHPNPPGMLGRVRAWLAQDIVVGDEPFDAAFLVTADPKAAAAALLQPALREKLLALAATRFAGFTYERDAVTVLVPGVELEPDVLGLAIDIALMASLYRI